jgi:hypothetical protein
MRVFSLCDPDTVPADIKPKITQIARLSDLNGLLGQAG